MTRILLLVLFNFIFQGLYAASTFYEVTVRDTSHVHVKAGFEMVTDTIFIFMRGATAELPQGEAEFVKNLRVSLAGKPIPARYVGEGNWVLAGANPGQFVDIEYDLETTHSKYNWDHTGGLDETAFASQDGLFFTGYTLFILPDTDIKNITVQFYLPQDWKASTPWHSQGKARFQVENGRQLVNNCFQLGTHQEMIIQAGGMSVLVAIANPLAYAQSMLDGMVKKLVPAYIEIFGATPAPAYLVVVNQQHMNDGSAFRRSFSLISNERLTAAGIPAWGYLLAHEMFHLWNGNAMMPAGGNEEWFREGVTDLMANLTLSRLGIYDEHQSLQKLSAISTRYWLDRFWQRDTLSIREAGLQKEKFRFGVYGGGALVAFALEIEIRKATGNKSGLHTVLKSMFREFGNAKEKFDLNDIIRIVKTETGKDMHWFFEKYLLATGRLEFKEYFEACGLLYNSAIEEVMIVRDPAASASQKDLYRAIFGKN